MGKMKRPSFITKNWADKKLETMTREAIAAELGVSPYVLRRWLNEVGANPKKDRGLQERPDWFTKEFAEEQLKKMHSYQLEKEMLVCRSVLDRWLKEIGVTHPRRGAKRPEWFTKDVYRKYKVLRMSDAQIARKAGTTKTIFNRWLRELEITPENKREWWESFKGEEE